MRGWTERQMNALIGKWESIAAPLLVWRKPPKPAPAPKSVHTCRWIEGDPSDMQFCGHPAKPGSSYCEDHHKRCYVAAVFKPGRQR